jgi:hypothetical protein
MNRKYLRFLMIFLLSIGFVSPSLAKRKVEEMKVVRRPVEPKRVVRIEKERMQFKKLIIQNPNYFGTFPDTKFEPVKPMKFNTKYEELKCLGFYPEQDLLEAIISVKLPNGYKTALCKRGSFEYVRFFVDWNNDGDFKDTDEDVGITSVNVHNIPNVKKVCLDKTKPLSYALSLKIAPKKYFCTFPRLVKVKAILSWEAPPTPGNPDYPSTWGNTIEGWIQIKPIKFFVKDIVKFLNLKQLKLKPSMLDLDIPISKSIELSPVDLKRMYKGRNVTELRYNFSKIYQIAQEIKQNPSLIIKYKLDPKFSQVVEHVNVILAEKPNTKYEQLNCVGLNYDLDTLMATLTVKKSLGYSGGLCTRGSYEYVGFWIYVYDKIEQMCLWKYLGTATVNVHDISKIPPGGLKYAVKLPVDLSKYRDKCYRPKVLKVRAILSWNKPPPTNNPFHNPTWGNKVDALIQIKPRKPVGTKQIPFITVVGGMAVESISGNPDTVIPSSIGSGYANGPSVLGGYSAIESPFGRTIAISGHISNPPNYSAGAAKLAYKVQYKKSGTPAWHDLSNKFRIWISTWNGMVWTMNHKDQTAPAGYYKYEEDLTLPVQHFVEGNVLAQWRTPMPEGDGLYDIRVLLKKPGAPPVPGVPLGHVSSNVVKIMVDNTAPKALVSLDAGPCTKFAVGDVFKGKFTAIDKHIWKYTLRITPSVPNPPAITPTGSTYPLLTPPGMTNEPYKVTTTSSTSPCGYVINLRVWDRTIINNHLIGNHKPATVGLCLLKEE